MAAGALQIFVNVELGLTAEIAQAIGRVLAARTPLERSVEISALRALHEAHQAGMRARLQLGLYGGAFSHVLVDWAIHERPAEPMLSPAQLTPELCALARAVPYNELPA